MDRSVFESIEKMASTLRQERQATLGVCHVPGLRFPGTALLDSECALIAPLSEDDLGYIPLLESRLFSQAGIAGPRMMLSRGRPDALSRIVAWHAGGNLSEWALTRLPLAALNLLVDSSRPLLVAESVIGRKNRDESASDLMLHDMPANEPTTVVPTSLRETASGFHSFADEIGKLLATLRATDRKERFFSIALDLFVSGDSKWGNPHQAAIRVIEYTTALEALLLEGEGEIAFRFGMRVSALLDPSGERAAAYSEARSLYKLRSIAVHGGARSQAIGESDCVFARSMLRRCLLRYLSLLGGGASKSHIVQQLDDAGLSDSARANIAAKLSEQSPWPTIELPGADPI